MNADSTLCADVGIIGGSGLYDLFPDARVIDVTTPYGEPSASITLAEIGSRIVAFLPRHGSRHELPPHRVNYRANIAALHQLGVEQILAPCAVGSLRPEMSAGTLAIPDQLVDWTKGRAQTFHDDFADQPLHARFADPYCPHARRAALQAADRQGWPAVDGGTLVVIDGPRFSTRAESQFFAAQGWSLINMTGHPEAVLARELGICYAAVALVTDLDAGLTAGDGVSVDEVLTVFATNTTRLRDVLVASVELLPPAGACKDCHAD